MSKQVKSRLGRGLSSLISVSDPPLVEREIARVEEIDRESGTGAGDVITEVTTPVGASEPLGAREVRSGLGSPIELPIDQITPNPHQPRREFNEAALNELAASLKSNGLIQPIVVRPMSVGGYQLVAGVRRLRASKLAGLSAIPAIIRDVDPFTQAQMALVENIHRADLNPIERASAYKSLIEQLGLTQAELAQRLGEDRTTITNFVRLMELPEPVRDLIRDQKLTLGHAKVLGGLTDKAEQQRLADLAVSQGLSIKNMERLISGSMTPPAVRPKPDVSAHLASLEKSFARQLGMRVQIKSKSGSKTKGRVVIHYATLDQFDHLMELLEIQEDTAD
jgi:ParB family chromosome partitioning protein